MSHSDLTTDLTIITVLRSGRHLTHSTLLHEGDDPARVVAAHCQVRGFYNDGHVERFVVIRGTDVETLEAHR
jgi:hypothetical protein